MASTAPGGVADFWEAVGSGDTARVTALLDGGVAVDSKNKFGHSALMLASWNGHTATVEVLVARKPDVNLQSKNDDTALFLAAFNGHTAVVEVLVAAGANMNILSTEHGVTPLMAAATNGDTATMKFLLARGAGVNILDLNGQTALYRAAANGHATVMETLVAAGADMNIASNDGTTPLIAAANNGHTSVVQFLLSARADMNIQDKNGHTALIAALLMREYRLARVLIEAGAGLNQQVKITGWTALFFAVKSDNLALVRFLLNRGVDPTVKCKDGTTAIDVAKKYGHGEILKELEKHVSSQPVVIPFKDLELEKTVGKGTFGVVHKGYWTSSGRGRQLVAVKQVTAVDEKEVKVLGSLCHPNIITLYGTSESKPYTYLVTDYAENGSLYNFISERPCSPDLKRTLPWAKQITEGMLYLHSRGIVHRDLKSNNVVLTSKWVAKICDLGTARAVDHTTLMTSVGTMAWIAPEIMMKKPASKPCDVYSYGVLLWELVTHDQPFKDHPPLLIPSEVVKGERPPIPESTDVAVKELIEKCWQTKPEDRPVFESVLYSLEECEMGKLEYGELEFSERVGGGAFGVVFRGFWNTKKAGKILVAIKNLLDKEDEKEVKVLSSLRHPNFTRYYGCVASQLHLSIVTEFAEKGSIAGYINKRKGKPERERALKWSREIAEAMRYLHERGFVHRDLKSENVVLTSDWTAKICDMGTAKKLKATVKQTFTGTMAWIAPEILREEPASQKCDVYSYAIVLWELATFQVPFEGLGGLMIPEKVFRGERPAIPSDCDQSLSDLIQRCWVDDYKVRPPFDDILKTLKSFA